MGATHDDQGGDDIPPDTSRDETPAERLDRNWGDLLQELRVAQTGVQLLTGFLLTLPFQSEFAGLADYQRYLYLATVGCAIAATGFLIAPVAIHRLLFRRHLRREMVTASHYLAIVGLALLTGAILGVVMLTFSVVAGNLAGAVATAAAFALLLTLWAGLPFALRGEAPDTPS
jgi:uncharacterized protein DUF6328